MKKPSPALVLAVVALFVALTSSAIAAKFIITSSAQVKNGVLTVKDFKKSERRKLVGPAGARGPAGAPGAAGERGRVGERGPAGTVDVTPWRFVGEASVPYGETFANEPFSESPLRFRREGDIVRLQGRTASSQPTPWSEYAKTLIFTLPEGFRPLDRELDFLVGGQSVANPGQVRVQRNGSVNILTFGNGSGWINLSNVVFATS